MLKSYKYFLFPLTGIFFFALFSLSVFAEDQDCLRISGSVQSDNVNSGLTNFNESQNMDLTIIGQTSKPGPALEYAACVEVGDIAEQSYQLKGYVWNDNLGFISLYCSGGVDGENLGIPCGQFNYGVEVKQSKSGEKSLYGYGWNESFGYLVFSYTDQTTGLPVSLVKVDNKGMLSGSAYTEAKTWIDFDGVTLTFPTMPVSCGNPFPQFAKEICPPQEVLDVCKTTPALCPVRYSHPFIVWTSVPARNYTGPDFIKNQLKTKAIADGKDYIELHLEMINDAKTRLITEYDLNSLQLDWLGNIYKDQLSTLSLPATVKPLKKDFAKVGSSGFHYRAPVRSYAPSMESNLSEILTVTDGVILNGASSVQENKLSLKGVTVGVLATDGSGQSESFTKTFSGNLPFEFVPAFDVNTLYAGLQQDVFNSYRGIPTGITYGLYKNSLRGDLWYGKPRLEMKLSVENESEVLADGCGGTFKFGFLPEDASTEGDIGGKLLRFADALFENLTVSPGLLALMTGINIPEDELNPQLCTYAVDPKVLLQSVISYKVPEFSKSEIKYYSNRLPRLTDIAANPIAVIRGNVYAAVAFSPNTEVETIQRSGKGSLNSARDRVNENVAKKVLDKKAAHDPKGECVVDDLSGHSVDSCSEYVSLANIDKLSTSDNVKETLYFRDADVRLAPGNWERGRVIIVEGGNVFIDGDIWNHTNQRLALVVFRHYGDDLGESGNVYIDADVQNIQANIMADGTVFSYDKDVHTDGTDFDTNGVPVWTYEQMVMALQKPLFIEGSVYSRNTVGGADLDSERNPRTYLLDGLGAKHDVAGLSVEDRRKVQAYDLNYLRLFKKEFQRNADGEIKDFSCGLWLSYQEILNLPDRCDGPTVDDLGLPAYIPKPKGLENLDGGIKQPIYIYYVVPDNTSFIFAKPGAVNIK